MKSLRAALALLLLFVPASLSPAQYITAQQMEYLIRTTPRVVTAEQTFNDFILADLSPVLGTTPTISTQMIIGAGVNPSAFTPYYTMGFGIRISQETISGGGIKLETAAGYYGVGVTTGFYGESRVAVEGRVSDLAFWDAPEVALVSRSDGGETQPRATGLELSDPIWGLSMRNRDAAGPLLELFSGDDDTAELSVAADGEITPYVSAPAALLLCPGGPDLDHGQTICFDAADPGGPAWKVVIGSEVFYIETSTTHP